jgi:hypothetical protein
MDSPNDALRCSRCNMFHSDNLPCPTATHAPGPWNCWESALSRARDLWFVDGPRPEEADLHGEARAPRVAEVWTEANARLIAAAPELLAALKAIYAYTLPASHFFEGTPEFAAARAAIAKAEGSS